jgi:hypothetical protein
MQNSVIVMARALVIMLMFVTAKPLLAEAKDSFKKGCEEGHGSYVEEVDNVKCNTSGGLTITCDYKITHCAVSAQVVKTIKPTMDNLKANMTRKLQFTGWTVVPIQGKSGSQAQTSSQGKN